MAGSQSRHDSGATQWGRLTSAQPASSAPAPAQAASGTPSGTSPKCHPSDSTTRWATGPRRAGPCAPALDTDQPSSIRGHPDSARPRSVTKPARARSALGTAQTSMLACSMTVPRAWDTKCMVFMLRRRYQPHTSHQVARQPADFHIHDQSFSPRALTTTSAAPRLG